MNLADKKKAKEVTEKVQVPASKIEETLGKKIAIEVDYEGFFDNVEEDIKEGAKFFVHAVEELERALFLMCKEDFVKETLQEKLLGFKLSAQVQLDKPSIAFEEGYIVEVMQIKDASTYWPIRSNEMQEFLEKNL